MWAHFIVFYNKSTIHPCMEYYSHMLAGTTYTLTADITGQPNCPCIISRTVQPLLHRCDVPSTNLFNQTTSCGHKTLSCIGTKLQNALPTYILSVNSINNFKHKLKENFFKDIQKIEDSLYILY